MRKEDLVDASAERFRDAEILFQNERWDASIYLCGYSIEIALKARLCQIQKWASLHKVVQGYGTVRIHDLDRLLEMSGIDNRIRTHGSLFAMWNLVVNQWSVDIRYLPNSNRDRRTVKSVIDASRVLLREIL